MSTDTKQDMLDTRRDFEGGAGLVALWFGVLAGPAAFFLNLQLGYMLVPWSCKSGGLFVVHLTAAICLALAVAGGLVAWRSWQRTGREWPGEGGGIIPRSRFMAALGVMTSALFALMVIAQWLPTLFLSPCQ